MSSISDAGDGWLPTFPPLESFSKLSAVVAVSSIAILLIFYLYASNRDPLGLKIPTYVLLEGAAIAQLLMGSPWLNRLVDVLLRRGPSPTYGITSGHHVVTSPALGSAVLKRPHEFLHNESGQWALQVRVFGTRDELRSTCNAIFDDLFAAVSKNLMQETHARKLVQSTYDLLGSLVPSMTSTAQPWLVNANPSSVADGSLDVDLYEMVRDFTTHVSIRMLAGTDFLNEYPNAATDLFAVDGAFTLFALGTPTWTPLPVIRGAVAARNRFLAQTKAFSERIEAVAIGTADMELQKRMQDVNGVFRDRSATYRRVQMSMEDRAGMEFALFWAFNGNTSPFVFWIIAYLYADRRLLARVREEIDPLISLVPGKGGSSILMDRIDSEGILQRCPLLKGTYFESFRLAHEPTSIRCIQQDFSVVDPTLPSDAPPLTLHKGTWLTVQRTVSQMDSSVYPEPNEFKPERFLREKDGNVKADYGLLRPWGEGASICKGRTFAEREVIIAVALIARCWDMQPVNGVWKVPGKVPGTGVYKPAARLRVRVLPREFD